jgi:hypothetical protein
VPRLKPPQEKSNPPSVLDDQLNGGIDRSLLEVVDRQELIWLMAALPARGMRALHAALKHDLGVTLISTGRGRTLEQQWDIFGGNHARYKHVPKSAFDSTPEKQRKRWKNPQRSQVRQFLAPKVVIPDEEFWVKKPLPNGNLPATAATPGNSPHGFWCADDVALGTFADPISVSTNRDVTDWLFTHELEYGFAHGPEDEPWHLQWVKRDEVPQKVLDFENTGRGGGRGRRRGRQEDDDMARLIKTDDAEAVFTVSGMVASHVPDEPTLGALQFVGLAPSTKAVIVPRGFFKSLRLIGNVPPGFSASDFLEVIRTSRR